MDWGQLTGYAEPASIVIGGVWAYWRFVFQRDRYPRVTLTPRIEQVAWHSGERVVRVSVDVRNEGSVRLIVPEMRYTLRTLRYGDPVVDGGPEILGQPEFPHVEVHRRPFTHPRHVYAFVDAGTTTTFTSVARVSASAHVALAQVTLRYRDPGSEFHGAVAVVELPVRSVGGLSPAPCQGLNR